MATFMKRLLDDCARDSDYATNLAKILDGATPSEQKTNATIALTGVIYRLFYQYRKSDATSEFDSLAKKVLTQMNLSDSFESFQYSQPKINDIHVSPFFIKGMFKLGKVIDPATNYTIDNIRTSWSSKSDIKKYKIVYSMFLKKMKTSQNVLSGYLNHNCNKYYKDLNLPSVKTENLHEIPFILHFEALQHFKTDTKNKFNELKTQNTAVTGMGAFIDQAKTKMDTVTDMLKHDLVAQFSKMIKSYSEIKLTPCVCVGGKFFKVPKPIDMHHGISYSYGKTSLHDAIKILSAASISDMDAFTKFVVASSLSRHRNHESLIDDYSVQTFKHNDDLASSTVSFLIRNVTILLKNQAMYEICSRGNYDGKAINQMESFIKAMKQRVDEFRDLHSAVYNNIKDEGKLFFGDENVISFDNTMEGGLVIPSALLFCPKLILDNAIRYVEAVDGIDNGAFINIFNDCIKDAKTDEEIRSGLLFMVQAYRTLKEGGKFSESVQKILNKYDVALSPIKPDIVACNTATVGIMKTIVERVTKIGHPKSELLGRLLTGVEDVVASTTEEDIALRTRKRQYTGDYPSKRQSTDVTPSGDASHTFQPPSGAPDMPRVDLPPAFTPRAEGAPGAPLAGQYMDLRWGADEYGSDVEF
jgi:hypothetical protein